MNKIRLGFLASLSLAIAGMSFWVWKHPNRKESVSYGTMPDFQAESVTSMGEGKIMKSDLLGKPCLINFIFTSCSDNCPRMTKRLSLLQKELPQDCQILSFTVDPENDTLDVLKNYAKKYDADPKRWRFLRMSGSSLKSLAEDGFKTSMSVNSSNLNGADITHSTSFILVNREGKIRGYYDAFDENSINELKKVLKSL